MGDLILLDSLDVVPILRSERAALIELLRSLLIEEWTRPTECPEWTIKGVALHLLCDDLSLLARQRDQATNSLDLLAETAPGLAFAALLNRFNESWVRLTEFLSPPLILDLLQATGNWTADFYATLDPLAIGEPMHWGEPEGAPYWLLAAREYTERLIHHLQVARAANGPGPLAPLYAITAAEVTLHRMPDSLCKALPAGCAIAVVLIDVERGWTLRAEETGWELYQGTDGTSEVSVAFTADTMLALLCLRLTRRQISEAVAISGDPSAVALVRAAFAGFSG